MLHTAEARTLNVWGRSLMFYPSTRRAAVVVEVYPQAEMASYIFCFIAPNPGGSL